MKYHDRRTKKLVDPVKVPKPTAENPRVPDYPTALMNILQNKSVFGGQIFPGAAPLIPESGASSG